MNHNGRFIHPQPCLSNGHQNKDYVDTLGGHLDVWPHASNGLKYPYHEGITSTGAIPYRRLVTYFYWRFQAPPAVDASRNGPIPQAVACEPPVENISTGGSLRELSVKFSYRKYRIAF